jgi:heme/copper-type cytochrome/quinol oxidase subunit 4
MTTETWEGQIIGPEELRSKRLRGARVALWLAVLTAVEFFLAIQITNALVGLVAIGVIKGWLILDYFMHVRDVSSEGGH